MGKKIKQDLIYWQFSMHYTWYSISLNKDIYCISLISDISQINKFHECIKKALLLRSILRGNLFLYMWKFFIIMEDFILLVWTALKKLSLRSFVSFVYQILHIKGVCCQYCMVEEAMVEWHASKQKKMKITN